MKYAKFVAKMSQKVFPVRVLQDTQFTFSGRHKNGVINSS